jgi:hypothetical protein
MPIEFQLRGLDKVGKKYEYKTIEVYVRTNGPEGRENAVEMAVRFEEVNGWIGDRNDCYNHHKFLRRDSKGNDEYDVYSVSYRRWIDEKEE